MIKVKSEHGAMQYFLKQRDTPCICVLGWEKCEVTAFFQAANFFRKVRGGKWKRT